MVEPGEVSTIFGIAGSCVGLIGVGFAIARSRASFMTRESCHKHVDEIKVEVGKIHTRIDSVKDDVSDVRENVAKIAGWVAARE